MKIRVHLNGCDDSTTVDFDVSPSEADVLHKLACAFTDASEYGCQPTMFVEVKDD